MAQSMGVTSYGQEFHSFLWARVVLCTIKNITNRISTTASISTRLRNVWTTGEEITQKINSICDVLQFIIVGVSGVITVGHSSRKSAFSN